MKEKMIAFCRIVCSDCRALIATQTIDAELKKEVAKCGRRRRTLSNQRILTATDV